MATWKEFSQVWWISSDFLSGPQQLPFKYFGLGMCSNGADLYSSQCADNENSPLDLSMSGNHSQNDSHGAKNRSELIVPHVQSKNGWAFIFILWINHEKACHLLWWLVLLNSKKKETSKKSYTEEELAAAVNDIRTGKLGTRRAAALYGIPRSTLRNKIFRLESTSSHHCDSRLSMSDLLQGMAANGDYSDPHKVVPLSMADWEHRFEQLRRKHDFHAGLDRPFGMPPLFYNSLYMRECEKAFSGSDPFSYELKLPFLNDLVRKFATQRMDYERLPLAHPPDMMSFLGAYKSEGGLGSLAKGGIHLGEPLGNSSLGSSSSSSFSSPQVELKIPSYKPMHLFNQMSGSNGSERQSPLMESPYPSADSDALNLSSNKIQDTLKDIISKTITEKVKTRANLPGFCPSLPFGNPNNIQFDARDKTSRADETNSNGHDEPPPLKKLKTSTVKSSADSDGSGTDARKDDQDGEQKQTKKTRPKRGQYRKYNSQLLVEAVKAVQRGEMSVHRAGSYFGVPHSTLEYKVKERHLLRNKKPREPRPKKADEGSLSKSPTDSPENVDKKPTSEDSKSSDQGGMASPDRSSSPERASPPALKHVSSASKSLPSAAASLSAFSMAGGLPLGYGWPPILNGSLPPFPDPALPSYLPGFGINTSASDLLKKLQRKVQAQESCPEPKEDCPHTAPASEGSSPAASTSVGSGGGSSSQVAVKWPTRLCTDFPGCCVHIIILQVFGLNTYWMLKKWNILRKKLIGWLCPTLNNNECVCCCKRYSLLSLSCAKVTQVWLIPDMNAFCGKVCDLILAPLLMEAIQIIALFHSSVFLTFSSVLCDCIYKIPHEYAWYHYGMSCEFKCSCPNVYAFLSKQNDMHV